MPIEPSALPPALHIFHTPTPEAATVTAAQPIPPAPPPNRPETMVPLHQKCMYFNPHKEPGFDEHV